jgi:5-methylcytosine-specific restriction protein A
MPRLSFAGLCAALGCSLTNFRDRWSGRSPDGQRVVFTIWEHEIKKGRYKFGPKISTDGRAGSRELREHIALALTGAEAFGIPCEAKDRREETWSRKSFRGDSIFVLRIVEERGGYFAYITGEVPVSAVIQRTVWKSIRPVSSVFDDLLQDDIGAITPDRAVRWISAFRRDPRVREKVLRRAKGVCEFCGTEGFEKTDGNRYLETHHVISLASKGMDTLDNVIALCPSHHREAHYGKDAALLEVSLLNRLKEIRAKRQRKRAEI